MPYDEPEFEDPQELVGVVLPGDRETIREMASAFAEEFARLGFPYGRIIALFENGHYAGAHRALLALGRAETESLVGEAVARWGGFRVRTEDAQGSGDGGRSRLPLRVLGQGER